MSKLKLKVLANRGRDDIEKKAIAKFKKTKIVEKIVADKIVEYESFISEQQVNISKDEIKLSKAIIAKEKKEISDRIESCKTQKQKFENYLKNFKELNDSITNKYKGFQFSCEITTDPLLSNQQVLDNLKSEQPTDTRTLWTDAPLHNLELIKFENEINDIYRELHKELISQESNFVIEASQKQLEDKLFISLEKPDKINIGKKSIAYVTELRRKVEPDYEVTHWYDSTIEKLRNEDFEILTVYFNKYYLRDVSLYDFNIAERRVQLIARIGLSGIKPDIQTYSCAVFLLMINNGFKFQRQKISHNGKLLSQGRLFAQIVILSLSNHHAMCDDLKEKLRILGFDRLQLSRIVSKLKYWRIRRDLPEITNKNINSVEDTITGYLEYKKRFGFYTSINMENPRISEEDKLKKLRTKWQNKADIVTTYFQKVELTEMASWQKDPYAYIKSRIPEKYS